MMLELFAPKQREIEKRALGFYDSFLKTKDKSLAYSTSEKAKNLICSAGNKHSPFEYRKLLRIVNCPR